MITNKFQKFLQLVADNKLLFFTVIFVVVAILGRFVVHLPNFTPIGALALFAGFYLPKRYAVILPIAVMFVCDLFIGFYNPAVMLVVYGSFIGITLAVGLLKKHRSALVIGGATLASSLVFFLTTNFAVWAFANYYEHTLAGLLYCFTLALPFLKYSLMGDFFWVAIFFGSYAYYVLREKRSLPLGDLQAVTVKI